jgi:autotransporter-associated beta strand protein
MGTGSGSSGLIDLGGATRTFDVVNVVSGHRPVGERADHQRCAQQDQHRTLGLNATNTYSGTTTVQEGRIELGGSLNG